MIKEGSKDLSKTSWSAIPRNASPLKYENFRKRCIVPLRIITHSTRETLFFDEIILRKA